MARMVRTREASESSGIPVRSLEAWRLRGGGPPYYAVGRAVYYDVDELMAWMRSRRRMRTSDPGPEDVSV